MKFKIILVVFAVAVVAVTVSRSATLNDIPRQLVYARDLASDVVDLLNSTATGAIATMRDTVLPDTTAAWYTRMHAEIVDSATGLDERKMDAAAFPDSVADGIARAVGVSVQAYSATMDTDGTDDMMAAAFPDSINNPRDDMDINGGTIDGTTIGATTPDAITGTTITGSAYVLNGALTRLLPVNLFTVAYQDSVAGFSTQAVGADTSMSASIDRRYWSFVHSASPTPQQVGASTVAIFEPSNPDSIAFEMLATALTDTVQVRVRIKSGATNTFNSDWVSVSAINAWEHKAFVAPAFTANAAYEVLIECRAKLEKSAYVAGLRTISIAH